MRRAVRECFFGWNTPHEGYLTFMYLDQHYGPDGKLDPLVTTGVGNLIDPLSEAIGLPWEWPDGRLATVDEIAAAWRRVKFDKTLDPRNGGVQYKTLTTLRLSREAVEVLVLRRLLQNDAILRRRFPEIEAWPADAQLGIHSLAWAYGAALESGPAPYIRFCKAADRQDFEAMAIECGIKRNPGRTAAQTALFLSAARIVRDGRDYDVLGGGDVPLFTAPLSVAMGLGIRKSIEEDVAAHEPDLGDA